MSEDRGFTDAERQNAGERFALSIPMHICDPIVVGRLPNAEDAGKPPIASATVTFLDTGSRKFAVTNAHVIRAFESKRATDDRVFVQIGEHKIENVMERLIDIEDRSDLATLGISDLALPSRVVPQEATEERRALIEGLHYHVAAKWPPDPVREGDTLAYGGWPGALRVVSEDGRHLEHNAYSFIGVQVTLAMPDRFRVRLDRNALRRVSGETKWDEADYDFGGMSGGPVLRRGPIAYELVGFIYEYQDLADTFAATSATNIKTDGTLWHNSNR